MPQRGIRTELWDHPDFEELSMEAKLLFIYLCTTPRANNAGMFRLSAKGVHDHTGIPVDRLAGLWEELKVMDIEYLQDERMVWVKRFIRHQAHSPLFLRGVAKSLEQISNKALVKRFLEYNTTIEIPFHNGLETVVEPFAKGSLPDTDNIPDNDSVLDKGGEDVSSSEAPQASQSEESAGVLELPGWLATILAFKVFQPAKGKAWDDYISEIWGRFGDIDLDFEAEKFVAYWGSGKRKLQRPWLSWLNWLGSDVPKKGMASQARPRQGGYIGDHGWGATGSPSDEDMKRFERGELDFPEWFTKQKRDIALRHGCLPPPDVIKTLISRGLWPDPAFPELAAKVKVLVQEDEEYIKILESLTPLQRQIITEPLPGEPGYGEAQKEALDG